MSIEKAIEVGEAKVKEMTAEKEAKRVASLSPEEKKANEASVLKAKQAAADKAILESKDETLDEAGKAKKSELIESEKRAKAEETKKLLESKDEDLSAADAAKKSEALKKAQADKEAAKEANIQARIDEIDGKFKASEAKRLEAEKRLAELEAKQSAKDPSKIQSEIKRLESERIAKLVEADKDLDRAERREMPKEVFEDWMVEDMTAATEWLSDRAVRRDKERTADLQRLSETNDGNGMKEKAEAVIKKQEESNARVYAKHPELNVTARIKDLRSKGKTDAEIQGIIKNDPKCKLAIEIIQGDQDKYLLNENGPEMVMAEMERRLAKGRGESQEDRDKRIADEAVEAERQRQANIDEGINSTRGKGTETKMGDLEKGQWNQFQKAFPQKTFADFRAMQERRKRYANA